MAELQGLPVMVARDLHVNGEGGGLWTFLEISDIHTPIVTC